MGKNIAAKMNLEFITPSNISLSIIFLIATDTFNQLLVQSFFRYVSYGPDYYEKCQSYTNHPCLLIHVLRPHFETVPSTLPYTASQIHLRIGSESFDNPSVSVLDNFTKLASETSDTV